MPDLDMHSFSASVSRIMLQRRYIGTRAWQLRPPTWCCRPNARASSGVGRIAAQVEVLVPPEQLPVLESKPIKQNLSIEVLGQN